MATERLSMRQTREILRQKWRLGRTHREVAQSLGISCGAVGTTVLRARAAGLEATGFSPSSLLSPGVLDAVRRIADPPTVVEEGPAPVPRGCIRIRALAILVDRDRLGHIVQRGDVYDFPEAAAKDFIKRKAAEKS